MLKKTFQSIAIGLCCAIFILWGLPYLTGNPLGFWKNSSPKIQSFSPAVSIASPAVVNVYNQSFQKVNNDSHSAESLRVNSLGSGVIMRSDGYILTNQHVINNADQIVIARQNGQIYEATLVGSDKLTDLAVLKIRANDLPTIPQNNKRKVRVGDVVLAIGNPYNLGQSVSQGIISATGRNSLGEVGRQDFLQTDASINRGNSGGALINTAGELIGINTLTLGKSADNGVAEGLSFSIPIQIADHVMNQIIKDGRVIRGYLGLQSKIFYNDADGLDVNNQGVLITGVTQNGPAAEAGIRVGDMIVSFDKKNIISPTKLMTKVANINPGTTIPVTVVRAKKSIHLKVTIGEYPEN